MRVLAAIAGLFCALHALAQAESTAPATASVRLQVSPQGSVGAKVMGSVLVRSNQDASNTQTFPIGDDPIVFRGPVGSAWQVELQAPGWWMDPVPVTLAEDNVIPLRVWRTATLVGTFVSTPPAKVPPSVKVEAEAPPWRQNDSGIQRGTPFQCSDVDAATGGWSCEVPATSLDVAIVASGHIPHYKWGLQLRPGERYDAGRLTLRTGGSVVAWLDPEMRPDRERPAVASIRREVARDASEVARQLAKPVVEAMVQGDGFVQLAPIPEGAYVLEVSAPGFATARIFPVRVVQNRESAVRRAIRLTRPIAIAVAVDPASDPWGVGWSAIVQRASDFGAGYDPKPVFTGPLSDAGEIAVRDQSPGRFKVTLLDHAKNRVAEEEFDVRSEHDAQFRLHVPVVHVKGQVMRGGKPLAARLFFGGVHGVTSIEMQANDAGEFSGWVPRAGEWPVDLETPDKAVSTALKVLAEEGRPITIAVPETRVAGTVVSSAGPVPDAQVILTDGKGISIKTVTDADGGFVFNGAVPGVYELGARSRGTGANTPFVRIDLPSPDSERLGIRLELGPLETVSGRIMSGGVPVAGAQVYTMGMGAGSREGTSGVTDLDGRFEVRIAADGTRALFVVMAPGRPLKAFERSLESDLTFDLPQTGGALELHLPSGPSGLGLFQNGVPLPLPLALSWARTHGLVLKEGAPITIPDVDVAHYRVCRPPTSSEPRCAEGRVVPGGTLKLEMAAIQ